MQLNKVNGRKIGFAVVLGVSVGLAGAAFRHPTNAAPATTAVITTNTPYIVPVNTTAPPFSLARESGAGQESTVVMTLPTETDQVERLKTRNRRLEALVTVLRQRATGRQ